MNKNLQVVSGKLPSSKNSLHSFQHATVHKDFLLHLFNPANDGKTSHEYFTNHGGKIVMYNSANEKSEITKIKPLPNFAEFKLLMSLLYYSQKHKTRSVSFNSIHELLESVGYTGGNNYELFDRMVERYLWFRIFFDKSLTLDLTNEDLNDDIYDSNFIANKGKKNGVLATRKIDILETVYINQNTGNSVKIVFDPRFWNMCHCKYLWSKTINLAVIKELKSPRQLQIYLFLCEWMNYQCYAKWSLITIESFIQETGLHFNLNDPSTYRRLMSEIKQTLEMIYQIELSCLNQAKQSTTKSQMWNIKLRETVFKQQRKIQFVSPVMKFGAGNSNNKDTDVMELSEWKELFPEINTDYWVQCTHTKDFYVERKPLPLKFMEQVKKQIKKKQIENKHHEDPYADF